MTKTYVVSITAALLAGFSSFLAAQSPSPLPPAKQSIEQQYTQERMAGTQNPAPKDPQAAYPIAPEVPFETGIISDCSPPFSSQDVTITSCWQGMENGVRTFVYTGAEAESFDPQQGIVYVMLQPDYPAQVSVQTILTPVRAGAVNIVSGQNGLLRLVSATGSYVLTFDASSGLFTSVLVDNTPPEVFNQFDPVTKDVLLYGRDSLSGVAPGPIQPISIVSLGHSKDDDGDDMGCPDGDDVKKELRTYRVFDLTGNFVLLVEKVKRRDSLLRAKLVSIQYGQAPAITLPRNRESFDWTLAKDSSLKELDQDLRIAPNWDGSRVEADFDARANRTIIINETPKPKTTTVKPGLALLRMATSVGKLNIEF